MCVLFIACSVHPGLPLVIAANRDEYHNRPTEPADFWADEPRILGGRDALHGGTWLGVTRCGRVAALTNFRDGLTDPHRRSRGKLVSDFLRGTMGPREYLEGVRRRGAQYNGFSLVAGAVDGLFYLSNRDGTVRSVSRGVHGLSNHFLDTPWPKVEQGRRAVAARLDTGRCVVPDLFGILESRDAAPDHALPDTGLGIERERELSPLFVVGERYGTRSSTVLCIDAHGNAEFIERTYLGPPPAVNERRFQFVIGPRPANMEQGIGTATASARQNPPP